MNTMNHRARVARRSVAGAASVVLHLALLLAVLWPAAAVRSSGGNADKDVEVRLIDDAGDFRIKTDSLAERTPDPAAEGEPSKTALSKCDGRTYTGIGVRVWFSGTILEVAPGGPADNAGLRTGDRLLDLDATAPDLHQAGTPIVLRYRRDERDMPPVMAVIAELCNEQAKPPEREPGTV